MGVLAQRWTRSPNLHLGAPCGGAGRDGLGPAFKAAEALLCRHRIDRQTIDYVIFCTQTPDYLIPTTRILQDRLRLPKSAGD